MKWSTFYDNYTEWEDIKIVHNISLLENIGRVDEITDVVGYISSEKACNMLIEKALKEDTGFSIRDIKDIMDYVNSEITERMIKAAIDRGTDISYDDIEDFELYVGEDFLQYIIMDQFDRNPEYRAKDILKYADYISEDNLKNLVLKCKGKFTEEELDELSCYLDSGFMKKLYRQYGLNTEIEDEADDKRCYEIPVEKRGFLKKCYDYWFIWDTTHGIRKLIKKLF